MPSLFRRAALKAGEAVDRVFGEEFEVTPMRRAGGDVNARLQPDPDRATFVFVGAFAYDDTAFHAEGRRASANATRGGAAPRAWIEAATAALTQPLRRDDRIRRVETGETFDVDRGVAGDVGRTRIALAERQARAG